MIRRTAAAALALAVLATACAGLEGLGKLTFDQTDGGGGFGGTGPSSTAVGPGGMGGAGGNGGQGKTTAAATTATTTGGGQGGAGAALEWTATAPAALGLEQLPAWLVLSSPGGERTSQIGPSTVATAFPPDAPRARSVDGMAWGLSLEPTRTNECYPSRVPQNDNGVWVSHVADGNAILTTGFAPGPGGGLGATRVQLQPGEFGPRTEGLPADTGPRTASIWVKRNDHDVTYAHAGYIPSIGNHFSIPDPTTQVWTRLDAARMLGAEVLSTGFDARALQNPAYDGMPVDVLADYCQLEAGLYPTSVILTNKQGPTTRAADSLVVAPAAAALPGGYLTFALRFAPAYAHDEMSADHDLLYLDAADRLFVSASGRNVQLMMSGVGGAKALTTHALTWARNQELTVKLVVAADQVLLEVSGDSGGGDQVKAGGVAPFTLPAKVYLLGSDAGTEEAADLRYVRFN